MKPRVAAVLNKAADIVEKRGWTQGDFARMEDGDFCPANSEHAVAWCMEGAMARAIYELKEDRGLLARCCWFMGEHLGFGIRTSLWNDDEGRTREEVVRELRACAENLP